MIRIEPRNAPSRLMTVGIPVLSAVIALALAAIPLAFAGAPIGPAYAQMFRGVFGSMFSFSEMLTRATPLIFTGLAAIAKADGSVDDHEISALQTLAKTCGVNERFIDSIL